MKKLSFTLLILIAIGLLLVGCGGQSATEKPTNEQPAAQEPAPQPEPKEPAAETAAYVGSETCKSCHSEKYENWKDSLHSKMIQDPKANPDVIIGDFSAEGDPLTMTGLSKDDIVYTIGSKWKQRYVVEKDGALRILPKQWVVKTGEWTDYHKDDWDKRAYEDLCIACHSTGYDPETKEFKEMGIGCESCHGPGSLHVQNGGDKSKIINPANFNSEQLVELCGSCHVRGENNDGVREDALGYLPGDDLQAHFTPGTPETKPDWFYENGDSKKHHQQYNDFVQSKHFETGSVTCITCHDSHSSAESLLKKSKDQLCASCHGDKYSVEKNMPKRAKSATPGDITTHTFRAEYPAQ